MNDRTIENNGIGALYATFRTELTSSNVNDAVTLIGDNEVGNVGVYYQGTLFGQLAHVDGSGLCTVQIRGIMRLRIVEPFPRNGGTVTVINGAVAHPMDAIGKRGLVLAVNEKDMSCDILL